MHLATCGASGSLGQHAQSGALEAVAYLRTPRRSPIVPHWPGWLARPCCCWRVRRHLQHRAGASDQPSRGQEFRKCGVPCRERRQGLPGSPGCFGAAPSPLLRLAFGGYANYSQRAQALRSSQLGSSMDISRSKFLAFLWAWVRPISQRAPAQAAPTTRSNRNHRRPS